MCTGTENESLHQQWETSVNVLVKELRDQCLSELKSQSEPQPSSSAAINRELDNSSLEEITLLSNKWFKQVSLLYNEPHRAYHNMVHVKDVLSSLEFLLEGNDTSHSTPTHSSSSSSTPPQNISIDEAIATLAAFFHDVIYNPKSSTNEKDSANLFLQFASELCNIIFTSLGKNAMDGGFDHQAGNSVSIQEQKSSILSSMMKSRIVSKTDQCIVATATHISSATQAHLTNNTIVATFLDADMSILGKGALSYDKYAGAIRKEYGFVEREVYCTKRAEILQSFLPLMENAIESAATDAKAKSSSGSDSAIDTPSSSGEQMKNHSFIYATEKGRKRWEDGARQNLKREIEMLQRGEIPCENES